MTDHITLALDAMGGDHGPSVVVPAAVKALANHRDLSLILVGQEEVIRPVLESQAGVSALGDRLSVHPASQIVAMDELPSVALRSKKDSSMRVAINLVKEGKADACVSAGNTGALMATARFVLKTLPGIDRPAICTAVPSSEGSTYILDLGANIDVSPEHLFQFAVMGTELVSAVAHNPNPRVGLLNIGEEEIKGNEAIKEAGRRLASSELNYVGFVEGDNIYLGGADVVVCDGFVGNVALKTSEGVAKLISQFLKEEFKRNLLTKFFGLVSISVLKALRRRIDPRCYNGASLLGLRKIVVKSHGGADELAFRNAIRTAVIEAREDVPQRISKHVGEHLRERQAV